MMVKTMEPQAVMPSLLVIVVMCGSVMMAPPIIQNGTMNQAQEEDQPVSTTLSRVNSAKPWLIEGDIAVKMDGRKIITGQTNHWSNAEVFYTFHPELSADIRSTIQTAISAYENSTCVRFIPRTSQANYVQFKGNEESCWSSVGMAGGQQDLNLGPGCNLVKIALHEIGHVLGMFHEQSRPDRDQYVTILTQNVEADLQHNFGIANNSETLGVPYDFLSIMHYDQHVFASSPDLVTIQAKHAYSQFQNTMGTGTVLTSNDIAIINLVYCPSVSTAAPTPAVTSAPVDPVVSTIPTTPAPGISSVECVGYQEVLVGAGQRLTITSKNFPNSYDTNMFCRIRLVPAADTQLEITVKEWTTDSYHCRDRLVIRKEGSRGGFSFCGNRSNFRFSYGPVNISFRSRKSRRYNRGPKIFIIEVQGISSNN